MLLVCLDMIVTTHHWTNCQCNLFQLHPHLCIYTSCIYAAIHHHKVYLDWLQNELESDSRFPRRWQSSKLRDAVEGHIPAMMQIPLEPSVEWTWRCNWKPWSSDLCDAFRAQCCEMGKLEYREPRVNTPPHVSQHWKGTHQTEQLWHEEHRKLVRGCDNTQQRGTTQIVCIYGNSPRVHGNQELGKIECVLHCIKIRWDDGHLPWSIPNIYSPSHCPSLLPLYLYMPHLIAQPIPVISVSPYTCHCSVNLWFPCISVWLRLFSPSEVSLYLRMFSAGIPLPSCVGVVVVRNEFHTTTPPWLFVQSTSLFFHIPYNLICNGKT